MNGVRFAKHIDAAHGTVKRWLHEGMPARRDGNSVWIDPAAAAAWLDVKYKGRKPLALGRRSYVYVAHRLDDGAIKIGFATDVMRRISELRKLSQSAVELVACMPGGKPDELRLHAQFSTYRIDGEWFSVPLSNVVHALRWAA
jgi:hypothetical protein